MYFLLENVIKILRNIKKQKKCNNVKNYQTNAHKIKIELKFYQETQ